MTYKVLITCPPMLRQIDQFRGEFADLAIEIATPDVVQTLSVEELIDMVPQYDGWIIGDDLATAEVFEAGKAGRLKAAVKWGIGVDNVDFTACKRLGISITNTPGMFGSEVADLAMCYILGLARDAFFIDREVRSGNWPKPAGISLEGKTIGIVGCGDIGRNIAKRANAHDLNIIGWDPYPNNLPDYINYKKNWPLGLNECDFIILACALNEHNNHLLNDEILDLLKDGVRIVNISRGGLINEESLIKGLNSGKICSAALDVFETEPLNANHDILNHPKCILGSHNASNTVDAVERASIEAISKLYEMLKLQR